MFFRYILIAYSHHYVVPSAFLYCLQICMCLAFNRLYSNCEKTPQWKLSHPYYGPDFVGSFTNILQAVLLLVVCWLIGVM